MGVLFTGAVVQMGLDDIFDHVLDDSSIEDAAYNAAMGTYAPVSGDITVDYNNAYTNPGASFLFSGNVGDTVILPASPDINLQDQLALNLRIRPDAESGRHVTEDDGTQITPLVRKGSDNEAAYRVDLEKRPDDDLLRIRVTLKTSTTEYQLSSEPLIQAEQWSLIGIQLQNNVLTLGVGAARFYSSVSEPLIAQSVNSPLVLGSGFKGHIDDVRLFSTARNNAMLQFADGSQTQTLTFDGNGKATATIQATGNTVATHQRVGFSELLDGGPIASSGHKRELNVASRAMGRLLPFTMRQAWADDISGVQQINQLEQGVAVVNNSEFAQTMDFIKSAGKEVYDLFKQAAEMLFDLSGFSDVWTIGKAIYLWMDDRFDEVDKFDLVFAGIGLTLTIVAVITAPAGGGGTLALKGSLRGLKALLKECVSDPVMLLKAGGTAVNWTFKLLKDFFSGPAGREKALASLIDLKDLLTDMFSTGGKTLLTFFTSIVRTPAQFVSLIKLHKLSKVCAIPAAASSNLYWNRITGFALLYEVQPAYAASATLCGEQLVAVVQQALKAYPEHTQGMVNILQRLTSARGLISADTIEKLMYLANKGHLDTLDNMLKAIEDNKIIYAYQGKAVISLADFAAEAVNKGSPMGMSVYDYFLNHLHELSKIGELSDKLRQETDAIISSIKVDTNGYITSLKLKGITGEIDGVISMLDDEIYKGNLTLLTVKDKVPGDAMFDARRNGQQGVDAVADWKVSSDSQRKVHMESKCFSSSFAKAEGLKKLDEQFVKHLEENVIRFLSIGDNGISWQEGYGMPRLDYRLSCGFWDKSGVEADAIKSRFKEIIRSGITESGKKVLDGGRLSMWSREVDDFEEVLNDLIQVKILPDRVKPLTN